MQFDILSANHSPLNLTSGTACTMQGIDSLSPTIMKATMPL